MSVCVSCESGPAAAVDNGDSQGDLVEELEEMFWVCDWDPDPAGAGDVVTPAEEMTDASWPHIADHDGTDVVDSDYEGHARGTVEAHLRSDGDSEDAADNT